MKKLNIKVSDKLYAILNAMCETDKETPESIAAALVFEKIFEDEIDSLWEEIDVLGEEFADDTEIASAISRICDILTYCSYSVDLPADESVKSLSAMVELLKQYREDKSNKDVIVDFVAKLDEKLGDQVPNEEVLAKYNHECDCNHEHHDEHNCGCGH